MLLVDKFNTTKYLRDFLEEAPLLETIPFIQTDDLGLDKSVLTGHIVADASEVGYFGGHEGYFKRKLPKVIRKAGMYFERDLFYNGFLKNALDNKNVVYSDAVEDKCYTIIAVRYNDDETTGLQLPDVGAGGIPHIIPTYDNNGFSFTAQEGKFEGIDVYGCGLEANFGVRIKGASSVAALVNNQKHKIPEESNIDKILTMVKACSKDTFLYMHPHVLSRLKNKYMRRRVHVEKYGPRMLEHWDGVRIVTSFNLYDGTEKRLSP
jgi:hypothetical protein